MKAKNIIFSTIIVFLWASITVAGKHLLVGTNSLQPIQLAFYRYLLGSIGLMIILAVKKRITFPSLRKTRPKKHQLIITTLIIASFPVLLFYGVQKTTAIASGILLNANTIFIAILSIIILKEKISTIQVTGIIIAFTGVIMILINEGDITSLLITSRQAIIGDLLALASGMVWAIFTITLKAWFQKTDPLEIMTYSITSATIIILLITVTTSTIRIPLTKGTITLLALLGIGATSIAFYLYLIILQEETATITGTIQLAVPVLGTILSVIFLKEMLSILSITGIILVLYGLYLSTKTNSNK